MSTLLVHNMSLLNSSSISWKETNHEAANCELSKQLTDNIRTENGDSHQPLSVSQMTLSRGFIVNSKSDSLASTCSIKLI